MIILPLLMNKVDAPLLLNKSADILFVKGLLIFLQLLKSLSGCPGIAIAIRPPVGRRNCTAQQPLRKSLNGKCEN